MGKTRITTICAFACAAWGADAALAQDAAAPKLGEVIVTAPKITESQPLNTTELGGAELRSRRPSTSDTASLLKNLPGLSLYGAGGVSSLPAIHGLADDRLRIKVDGMDLISACGNHMNPPLSYLDPTNVSHIQVFAGITPVSLGGDSIGGTIVAASPAPEFAADGEGTVLKGKPAPITAAMAMPRAPTCPRPSPTRPSA